MICRRQVRTRQNASVRSLRSVADVFPLGHVRGVRASRSADVADNGSIDLLLDEWLGTSSTLQITISPFASYTRAMDPSRPLPLRGDSVFVTAAAELPLGDLMIVVRHSGLEDLFGPNWVRDRLTFTPDDAKELLRKLRDHRPEFESSVKSFEFANHDANAIQSALEEMERQWRAVTSGLEAIAAEESPVHRIDVDFDLDE